MYATMPTRPLILILLLFSVVNTAESLECFSCTNVRNVSECQYVITCTSNEHCFTHVEGHGSNALFTLGCRNTQQCLSSATTPQPSPIIGRDVSGNSNVECSQCCAQDYCNKHMCSQAAQVNTSPNSQCQDDADYSCEAVGSTFNLCGDVLHAKTSCKKWCGLCDLVDGAWSSWSSWSDCDVTCTNGHKSRHRTCTNPTPVSGGSDCVGSPTETSTCVMKSCPVHGGWSQWSSWGTCSKTCGVGLERRDRSCSKPYPGPDGDPCFGDARDDRTCFIQACADGNWSYWSVWGNCSAMCDGGLKERSRKCDNPAPSTYGKYCIGDSVDTDICNTHTCKVPEVYFTVTTPNGNVVNTRPVFTKVIANVGHGYNTTSAQFICPVSGSYMFSTSFSSASTTAVYCYFYDNNTQIAYIRTTTTSSDRYDSVSSTVNIHLDKGDIFELSQCSNWNYVYTGNACLFTGVLLSPS